MRLHPFALAISVALLSVVALSAPTPTPGCQLIKDGKQFIQLPSFQICSDFTIEGYFMYPTAASLAERCSRIFDFGNGQNLNNIIVGFCNQPAASFRMADGDANFYTTGAYVPPTNTWFHVAFRCASTPTNTTCDLLFDGVVRRSATYPTVFSCMTRTNQYLGRSNWPADPFITLWVSSIRVWNSALPDATLASVRSQEIYAPQPGLTYFNNFTPLVCPASSLTGCTNSSETLPDGTPMAGCTVCAWGDPHVTGCDLGHKEIMYIDAIENDMFIDTIGAGFLYRARGGLRKWNAAVQTEVLFRCRRGAPNVVVKAVGKGYTVKINNVLTTLTVSMGFLNYAGVKVALLYDAPWPQVAVQCTDTTYLSGVISVRNDGSNAAQNTFLSVCVHVPQTMLGKTRGLIGAPNCIGTDDIQFCNGTIVPLTSLTTPYTGFKNPILRAVQKSWTNCSKDNETIFPDPSCTECGGTPIDCDFSSTLYTDGLYACSNCENNATVLNVEACAYDYCLSNGSIGFVQSNCDEGHTEEITTLITNPNPLPCNATTDCNGRGTCSPLGVCDCDYPYSPPSCLYTYPTPLPTETPTALPSATPTRRPSVTALPSRTPSITAAGPVPQPPGPGVPTPLPGNTPKKCNGNPCGAECCPFGAQCCGVPQKCCGLNSICCNDLCIPGSPTSTKCCETCVNGALPHSANCTVYPCAISQTCCGSSCCNSGQFCGGIGTRQTCCPRPWCGNECCSGSQTCLGGKCILPIVKNSFNAPATASSVGSASSMSAGLVAGVVAGGVAFVALAVFAVFKFQTVRRRNTNVAQPEKAHTIRM
mmetsp:Transcript_26226/g.42952  ORF Transcript_26226/g.42952 Transcript_26226/m.42952 type:complete len:816 (+) Transcript_26226:243-2690(+)|eukprot:CAMPEP_0184659338 /NCGR_PEP_ID=MMETSP0308-20130426/29146_1 /TAXON_ID=38269 /ORGANISM="Gloeochaete witrockiana, Strain SAG 46.84" /LENGTH=815 /DNA_ID=CAMNT_0027099063 /DNA_START=237 /DNA_END=2684 /DNA_ORIENTATION=+